MIDFAGLALTGTQTASGTARMRKPIWTCEPQYKCQLLLEFSIENTEIMENYPWRMSDFRFKMAIYFAIRGTRVHPRPSDAPGPDRPGQ